MKWSMIKGLSCCSTMCILHEDDIEREYDELSELEGSILFHDLKGGAFPRVAEGNVGVFVSAEEHAACMSGLSREFAEYHRLGRGVMRVFELVAANAGTQAVIDEVAKLYGAPASIIDNTYTPFAWSQSITPSSQRLRETWNGFTRGKMVADAMEKLKLGQILHPASRIEHARKWENAFGDEVITNYLTMIYINDIAVASFSVLYNDCALSETQLHFLPAIAKALSLEMQKSDFYILNKATYFTNLLAHILAPDSRLYLADLIERFSSFGYSLKRTKYILHASILDATLKDSQRRLVAERLRELFANSVYIIKESGVALLLSRDDDNLPTGSELEEWRKVVLSMGVRVGMSNPFESPADACLCLEQARRAAETGRRLDPGECLFRFEDYQFADFVSRLSESCDLSVYMYPPLKPLIESDFQRKSNLTYTLYVYLRHSRHSPKVCEELFIHKNTLYYRLGRIADIMRIDLERSDSVERQILLSFEIMKLNGEFDKLPK
jgi:hypothetical protein